ncbi:MAG: FAD-binding oxidoreductase [Solirubrobacteraceae bacterium]|nr:FAD-binding oxidoreductase [Solirubrobacteraceae bacterium]
MSSLSRRALLLRAGAAGAAVTAAQLPRELLATADARAASRIPSAWLRELMDELRGGVYLQDNPRYLTAQAIYNSRFDLVFPPAIARPLDAEDVRTAIAWAARHDVAVFPRGGGHGYTGNATTPHALVLDLRSIKGLTLSDGNRRVEVGGGALGIDVIAALAAKGVMVPTGSCPSVGITGLAMGGGIGSIARAHGLTADRVESLTIVTPDGELREVSETQEPDLFWACRGGGGGNVGVVTSMVLRTVPTVTETQITIRWPWPAAEQVLDAFLRTAPEAEHELTGDLAFSVDSSRQWPVVRYVGTFQGSVERARIAVAPLLSVEGASASFAAKTHLQSAMIAGYCEGMAISQCRPSRFGDLGRLGRSRFFAGSSFLPGPLDSTGRGALLRAVRRATPILNGRRTVILAALGGAIAEVDPSATAYPHRQAACAVQFLAQSSGSWEDYNARNWVRSGRNGLAPHATGGAYVNYLDLDQPGWEQAYYGDGLQRLQAVKAQYDPDRRFRPQQGIPAAG